MSNKPLSIKHRTFTRLVVEHGNATQAYRDAGYSPNGANASAAILLTKPSIKAEIARLEAIRETGTTITRAYVLSGLQALADNGKTETAKLRALELLGKTLRMFVDVRESSSSVAAVPALKSYTLDELVKLRDVMVNPPKAIPAPIEDVIDQPAD